jgi:hypothetical protein
MSEEQGVYVGRPSERRRWTSLIFRRSLRGWRKTCLRLLRGFILFWHFSGFILFFVIVNLL